MVKRPGYSAKELLRKGGVDTKIGPMGAKAGVSEPVIALSQKDSELDAVRGDGLLA